MNTPDSERPTRLESAVRALQTPLALFRVVRDAHGVIVDFEEEFANDAARADAWFTRDENRERAGGLPRALRPLFTRLCDVVETGRSLTPTRAARNIELQADRADDGVVLLWRTLDVPGHGPTPEPTDGQDEDLHARAEELQQLLDAAPAAIWIAHDPECHRITGSRFAAELLRMRPGDNLSKSAADDAPRHFTVRADGRDLEPHELPVQRAARGEEVRDFEEELVFEDGTIRALFGSALPLRDASGAVRGAISAFVDITALKQAEMRMREAQAVAEAANRLKDQFLATLSHELRTPLNAIIGYVTMLQTGRLPEERRMQALSVIERNGRLQLRLVEDLLDVARITAGTLRLTMERLSVHEELTYAIEAVQPMADEKAVELIALFEPSVSSAVDGDRLRLQQVFWNLLNNAVRFTSSGGRITVQATDDGTSVLVVVRDTGAGIPAEFQPFVFEPFRQGASGASGVQRGLGVGLTIAKRLIALHGGDIGVTSEGQDRGSEFWVRLPTAMG